MVSYCKNGDTPKVIYKFKNVEKHIFTSNVSPIDVTVSPVDNPDLDGERYAWNFSTTLNPRTTLDQMPFRAIGKLTHFKVERLYDTSTFGNVQIGEWICSFVDGNGVTVTGRATGYYPNDLPVLTKILIPGDIPLDIVYRIDVKDSSGHLLFTDSGKAPCDYDVACGNCPEGFCECPSPGYPGYCCLDCHEVAANIRSITNDLRSKYGK
ncbi:hypothetical protein [Nostoc sp.]|uniref:hypothetical protein n=1 Tax=Nostoc sp. TaxID=1180 RepID=UPI002FF74CFF